MQSTCNLCSKKSQDCLSCLEPKCNQKICLTCLNTLYVEKVGHICSWIALPCGHPRENKDLLERIRTKCCKCLKKIGKFFYELRDGRIIDALCLQSYPKSMFKILQISECKECRVKIGKSNFRQTKVAGQNYTANSPICLDCDKKFPQKTEKRQNNWFRSQNQQDSAKMVSPKKIISQKPKERSPIFTFEKWKQGQCINCNRLSVCCEEICEGTFLCHLCKRNESTYYEKKEEDVFEPQLFGKINRTKMICWQCNKLFQAQQLVQNKQIGRKCCKNCDWKIKEQEKIKIERERVQDSLLTEKTRKIEMKSDIPLITNDNYMLTEKEKNKNAKNSMSFAECLNFRQAEERGEREEMKKDQIKLEPPLKKTIDNFKKKKEGESREQTGQQSIKKQESLQLKVMINGLQKIKPCRGCGNFMEQDCFVFEKELSHLGNICLPCVVQRLNNLKIQRKQGKRAQSQGKFHKLENELKNSPKKQLMKNQILGKAEGQAILLKLQNNAVQSKISTLKKKKAAFNDEYYFCEDKFRQKK